MDYLCQLNASDSIPLVHLKQYGEEKQADDRQQILADTERFQFAVPKSIFGTKHKLGACTVTVLQGYIYLYAFKRGMFKIGTGMKGTVQGYLYSSNPDFVPPLSFSGSKNASLISSPQKQSGNPSTALKVDGDVNAITSKDLSFHTPTNASPSGKRAATKGRKNSSRKKGLQKEQQKIGNSKSASSQKGFGASLQTGKPDGFLFGFREKLFIYAQKGIQGSKQQISK